MSANTSFIGFFEFLREVGLPVAITEWLTFVEAMAKGHARASLGGTYNLGRAIMVKREGHLDLYDRAFATYFHGVENAFELDDKLWEWLENPKLPKLLSEEELAKLQALDLDALRRLLEERMREQKERHDGGNKWVGTGGTSPFGHGGTHPTGVRIGGSGGGRSAVQVAEDRQFQNLRSDRVIDTRQIGAALARLRRLGTGEGPEELDIDESIQKSAREAEIDLVFRPPRENRVKLLLLMDVGGSMDPHANLCERMFSAAHAASHFKAFRSYYFHNCVYEKLYTDMEQFQGEPTEDVLKSVDNTWTVVVVGDAWMSPYELTHVGGAVTYSHQNSIPGIAWLRRLTEKMPKAAWLNPEGRHLWHAPSIDLVRHVFPMFELTMDGLTSAVDHLRGARKVEPLNVGAKG